MDLATSKQGHTTILEVGGRLDAKAARVLDVAFTEQLSRGERNFLIVLSELEYLGGAGMRVLLGVSRRLETSRGKLVLCCLQPQVREVFDVAGFAFNLQPDRRAALKLLPTATRLSRISKLASRLLESRQRPISRKSPNEVGAQINELSARVKSLIGQPSPQEGDDLDPEPGELSEEPEQNFAGGRRSFSDWFSRFRSR